MRPLPLRTSSAFNGPSKTLAFLFFLPFLLLCSASTAEAVPVVITGGSIGTAMGSGNFGILATGMNFSFSGVDSGSPKQQICGLCLPGTEFSGPRQMSINLTLGLTYDGVIYKQDGHTVGDYIVTSGGNFITFPQVIVPDDLSPVVTTFSYVGGVSVHTRDGLFVNSFQLTGTGIATFTFAPGNPGFFNRGQASFEFAPEPVPEPATLILLGTGLAGVAAKLKRRGRRNQKAG